MLDNILNSPQKYLSSIFYLFIIFNFINREIAYLFLLTLIVCSLILCFTHRIRLSPQDNRIIIFIILFVSWLWFATYIHGSGLRYIDDYMRLLYLLPIYLLFSKKDIIIESHFIRVIKISSLFAFLHYAYFYNFVAVNAGQDIELERYGGTSSIAITYSYMLATMMIFGIYFFFKTSKEKPDYILMLSFLIFFLLYSQTGTKGLIPGIILSIMFILYWFRPRKIIIFVTFLPLLYIFASSDISQRVQQTIKFIDTYTLSSTDEKNSKQVYRSDESTYTRIRLIEYGFDTIEEKPIFGLGPQMLENDLHSKMREYNMRTTIRFGHLHNDFIDIAVKFGVPSVLLLIMIYFSLARKYISDNNKVCILILILFIVGQMTQSHFTHNQAVTFFTTILFCLSGKMNLKADAEVTK